MTTDTRTRWQTCRQAQVDCGVCGRRDRCTVAPDGTAFKCWRDGGRVHQMDGANYSRANNSTDYVGNGAKQKPKNPPPTWAKIEDAAAAAAEKIGGAVAGIYPYPGGNLTVIRIDLGPGEKEHRPFRRVPNGWTPGDPPAPLPLYRGDDLGDGMVYVVEGEKCTDAARSVGIPAVTSSHGSSAAAKTDWTPLAGRDVAILPDADAEGEAYATAVTEICRQLDPPAKVRIVRLPGPADRPKPKGWDVADWLDERDSVEPETLRAQVERWAADAEPVVSPHEPQIRTLRELIQQCPTLHPPVIEGLLREGETMNVIAPPKRGKSWLVGDLAVSIGMGMTWLNHYPTVQGDVLILDNELHGPTMASRLPKIAHARGLTTDAIADRIHVDCLRGRLIDLLSLGPYFDRIGRGRYRVVVLDALYRFWPRDCDENDNGTVAAMFSAIDAYAAKLGCAFVLIHHSTKGTQAGKAITDVGAGAGAQARAADTHLVLRDHDEAGCIVLEAAARSWPPLDAACFRWQFPVWTPAPDLDPTALRGSGKKGGKDDEPQWTPRTFAQQFVTGEPQTKERIVANAVDAGMKPYHVGKHLRLAEELGVVHRWQFGPRTAVKFANVEQPITRTVEGYE